MGTDKAGDRGCARDATRRPKMWTSLAFERNSLQVMAFYIEDLVYPLARLPCVCVCVCFCNRSVCPACVWVAFARDVSHGIIAFGLFRGCVCAQSLRFAFAHFRLRCVCEGCLARNLRLRNLRLQSLRFCVCVWRRAKLAILISH